MRFSVIVIVLLAICIMTAEAGWFKKLVKKHKKKLKKSIAKKKAKLHRKLLKGLQKAFYRSSGKYGGRPIFGTDCGPAIETVADQYKSGLVPDAWVYKNRKTRAKTTIDFSASCRTHDRCYEVCDGTKTRRECDFEFYEDLKQACREGLSGFQYRLCKKKAKLYRYSVEKFGGEQYCQ